MTRILSSPTTRCLQTTAPLAAERGLEAEPVDSVAVDGDARRLLRMLIDPALEAVVLCTYGEVIGEALEHAGEAGLRLLDPPRREKGSIWIVESGEGRLLEARSVEPTQQPATWSRH